MAAPSYCRKCGTRLSADSSFCPTCGASQMRIEQAPGSLPPQEPAILGTGRQPAGQMLHQRYRLLHTVGQGGMGAVYVAQDTQLGDRLVAVKEMSVSRLFPQDLPQAVEQFRREAHLLASLHHPNLPVIHEYFQDRDRWYLIMSFIEGQNLQAALNAVPGNKLPVKDVLRIGIELCEVLEYLHTHEPQVIFRDLKPLNIMLTPKGHICLIDFGIARHFKQEQTKDTVYYYSVGYAPPEQYGQSQTGPRSDIYSLGVTFHQMLSGHNPASKPFQFPNLQLVDPTLPLPLVKVVAKMLEMSEMARPASVADVKAQLTSILAQLESEVQKQVSVESEPKEQVKNEPLAKATPAPKKQELPPIRQDTTPVTGGARLLAALSYALFAVSSLVVLGFKPKQSRFLRFHAWQAFFLTFFIGLLLIIDAIIITVTGIGQTYGDEDYGDVDPGLVLLFLSPVIVIGVIYWLTGIIKAAQGKRIRLFPIGYLAALLVRKKETYNPGLSPFYQDLPRAKSGARVLAFLCYFLLGVPGLFILLLGPLFARGKAKSRFTRFHALQSLLFFLPSALLVGVSMGFILFLLAPVFVTAWLMGMYFSLSGKYFTLPLVGGLIASRISKNNQLA